jgi:hypothetical protein
MRMLRESFRIMHYRQLALLKQDTHHEFWLVVDEDASASGVKWYFNFGMARHGTVKRYIS